MIQEKFKGVSIDEQIEMLKRSIERGQRGYPIDIVDSFETDRQLYYELENGYWERYIYNVEGDCIGYLDSMGTTFGIGLEKYTKELTDLLHISESIFKQLIGDVFNVVETINSIEPVKYTKFDELNKIADDYIKDETIKPMLVLMIEDVKRNIFETDGYKVQHCELQGLQYIKDGINSLRFFPRMKSKRIDLEDIIDISGSLRLSPIVVQENTMPYKIIKNSFYGSKPTKKEVTKEKMVYVVELPIEKMVYVLMVSSCHKDDYIKMTDEDFIQLVKTYSKRNEKTRIYTLSEFQNNFNYNLLNDKDHSAPVIRII